MPLIHVLLALSVVVIWGVNFIFIRLGLDEFPPLLLCALRFLVASIPIIFFIKPPAIPFRIIILYGLVMFGMQFTLVFLGMHLGMTPGMASLIMQMQVFFSIFFVAIALREKPTLIQVLGAIVAFMGIGLVAFYLDKNITIQGFLCILGAAAASGIGTVITKKNNQVNMISLVVWGCFVASIPMTIATLTFDGWSTIVASYHHMTWVGISSLLYIVCISTWIGYGVWSWLISRYPVAMVAPYTLLVPVVGILSSVLVLEESFELWKLLSGLLVITGLYINQLSSSLFIVKSKREADY